MIKKIEYIKMIVTMALLMLLIVAIAINMFNVNVLFSGAIAIGKKEYGVISDYSLLSFLILLIIVFLYITFFNKYIDVDFIKQKILKLVNIYEYALIIVCAIVSAFIIFVFIGFPVTVEQTSMRPTFTADDRLIISSRIGRTHLDDLEREDVVVFKIDSSKLAVDSSYDNKLWIKRVIGMPGDKIEFVDGKLFVNGIAYEEEYLYDSFGDFKKGKDYDCKFSTSNKRCKSLSDVLALTGLSGDRIPDGYYLLLGDNRVYSYDSWSIGLIPEELILGKAEYKSLGIFRYEKIK